jgi:hypothetical protein
MQSLKALIVLPALTLLVLAGPLLSADKDEGWTVLFNGKDLSGWKLRSDKYGVTKLVDPDGKEIKGAKKGKLDQKDAVVDAKGKVIEGAKVAKIDGKDTPVDADGKPIKEARITKTGGRDAILGPDGKELKDAKALTETIANPTGGWKVAETGLLSCGNGPHGSDLFTEQKFGDFQLHVEFLGTGNSGVYLQGRHEIQIDNSFGAKPKIEDVDGKKIEVISKTICGALYGQIAPSKNMAKPPTEWQTFDITFHGARGEKGKVSKKARVTVVWNGEKVIDDAEIPNGTALDPGPVLLQGDHGKVTFRNIKIKPLTTN